MRTITRIVVLTLGLGSIGLAGDAAAKSKNNPWDGAWSGSWDGMAATKIIVSGGRVIEYDYKGAPQKNLGRTKISGDTLTFGTPPSFVVTLTSSGPSKASAHYHGPGGESNADLTKE
ncbi:MAG: hypothetical protein JO366_21695 [Methylobacteriaceae bacterium]|nr:hypothetical protein [Methylobacteriaceae bacterium]